MSRPGEEEETSIKQRLRSAMRGGMTSDGRETPITMPTDADGEHDDEEIVFHIHEAANTSTAYAQDSDEEDAERREEENKSDRSQSDLHEDGACPRQGPVLAVAAATSVRGMQKQDSDRNARSERMEGMRAFHAGVISYHSVGRNIWMRDTGAGRPTRYVKLSVNEVPMAAVIEEGLPPGDDIYLEDPVEEPPMPQSTEVDDEVERIIRRPIPRNVRAVSGSTSHVRHGLHPESGTAGRKQASETGAGDAQPRTAAAAGSEFRSVMESLRAQVKEMSQTITGMERENKAVGMAYEELRRYVTLQSKLEGEEDAVARGITQETANERIRRRSEFVGVQGAGTTPRSASLINIEKEGSKASELNKEEEIPRSGRNSTRSSASNGVPFLLQNSELPKFDGEHYNIFIDMFEQQARLQGWNDNEKMARFLPCIQGKPRMYLDADDGELLRYGEVKKRLEERYGSHASSFEIKQRIRNMRRTPGETMEDFADRLQALASRARLDRQDKQELFYRAFLDATADTPKLQLHIERLHKDHRDARLPDLLRWVREYRERSPVRFQHDERSINACLAIDKRKGQLRHDDDQVYDEVLEEEQQVQEEKQEREERKDKISAKELHYALSEVEWLKKVIKANELTRDLGEKLRRMGPDHSFQEPMGRPITEADLQRIRNSRWYNNSYQGRGGYGGSRGGYNRGRGRYGRNVGTHTAEGDDCADAEDEEQLE